jgi:hypothetical protein
VKKTKYNDYEMILRFPVWSHYAIHVVVGETIEKSVQSRYGVVSASKVEDADALTMSHDGKHGHIFFDMPSLFEPYLIAGNLAHESWHAVRRMLCYMGASDLPIDNETVAYHLGYTVERATKFFEEVRRDQRKRRTKSTAASKR